MAALSLFVNPGTASAATSVEISSATRSGSTLTVSGTASFEDQPFVELGTDPALDALPPGPSGLDLTEASIRTKVNGDLEFRWTLMGLPPVLDGLDMVFLGWTFCALGAQQTCFELDAGRFYHSQGLEQAMEQAAWSGQLWRCADASCAWGDLMGMDTPVELAVQNVPGSAAIVSASFPAGAIGASPGTEIVPVIVYPGGAVFAAVWQWHSELPGYGAYSQYGDGLDVTADYTVPARSVSLAIGSPGQDPADVVYPTSVSVAANGAFSAQLNVGSLSGPAEVYARACFGDQNCAYATRPVIL